MSTSDKEMNEFYYKENKALRELCTQLAYSVNARMVEKLISIAVQDKVEITTIKMEQEKEEANK